MLTPWSGIRIPVFINCSIHGGETTGMDAGLRLLRRLAFKDDAQTKRFLKEAIIIIDPCQNPDGRITDSRPNGNGFDCNRDFITLTQPENVITTNTLRTWLPTHDARPPRLRRPDADRADHDPAQPQPRVRPHHRLGPAAGPRHEGGPRRRDRAHRADPVPLGHG